MSAAEERRLAARPEIRGVAVTDLSAAFGAVLWVLAAFGGELGTIGRALALAPLVIVPLGLGLVTDAMFDGFAGQYLGAAVALQPAGAVLVVGSLLLPSVPIAALAAAAWLPVTGLLAIAGMLRAKSRGFGSLSDVSISESLVDAGLVYLPVAAVALVMSHLGITLWFDPVIVLLTAVHFHYAGFALPVLAGVTGRFLGESGRLYRVVGGVILAGPAIIAVGISFSPLVEFVAVGAFTLAATVYGGIVLVRVVPRVSVPQGLLIGLSALVLPVSMLLALGYGIAAFTGTDPFGLAISQMVSLHGTLNAYGFALLGVVGWRFLGES